MPNCMAKNCIKPSTFLGGQPFKLNCIKAIATMVKKRDLTLYLYSKITDNFKINY